ncbi:hypothetical protein [Amycolatopsis plumensis]|uniref:hypothetical protein n=1 Tax=Amycolatopsis plumensis TaxID=236508 RepID=UPI00360D5909
MRNPLLHNDFHLLQFRIRSHGTEVPHAFAEQRRHQVDPQLVEQPQVQALLGDRRSGHAHRSVSRRLARSIAVSTSAQNGGRCVTTNAAPPPGGWPPQAWVCSNTRRPQTKALWRIESRNVLRYSALAGATRNVIG